MKLPDLLRLCNFSLLAAGTGLREILAQAVGAELSALLQKSAGAASPAHFYRIQDIADVANPLLAAEGEARAKPLYAFILRNDLYAALPNARAFEYARSPGLIKGKVEDLKNGLLIIRSQCLVRRNCFFLTPGVFAIISPSDVNVPFGGDFFSAPLSSAPARENIPEAQNPEEDEE